MSENGTFVAPTRKFYNPSMKTAVRFSLPVGATGIFKRPLRGLKTAKTPAWVKNLPKRKVRKFRSSLFKGLQVSKGQSPLFAQGTDSYAFSQLLKPSKSGIPKKLTHFRLALDAVRSTGGEFFQQSGGLLEKEGATCKRGRPLKALPIRQLFLFGQYFGSPNGDN